MRCHSTVVLILLLALSVNPAAAHAAGKRNRAARVERNAAARSLDGRSLEGRSVDARSLDAQVRSPVTGQPLPRDPYAGRYPKFYGGFHSRELQNIGVPSGDIGLRGNGFSMFPW